MVKSGVFGTAFIRERPVIAHRAFRKRQRTDDDYAWILVAEFKLDLCWDASEDECFNSKQRARYVKN